MATIRVPAILELDAQTLLAEHGHVPSPTAQAHAAQCKTCDGSGYRERPLGDVGSCRDCCGTGRSTCGRGAPVSTCRSCGARIVWAVTDGDRPIPLDADPVDGGNVELTSEVRQSQRGSARVAVVHAPGQTALFDDRPVRYVAHFVTCPDADTWRNDR